MKKFLSLLASGAMLFGFAATSHAQMNIDQVKMGPGNALTLISQGGLTSPFTVTIPNPGAAANVILSTTNSGTQTLNGTVDFPGTVNFTNTPGLPLAVDQILIGNGASPSVGIASGALLTVNHTTGTLTSAAAINAGTNFQIGGTTVMQSPIATAIFVGQGAGNSSVTATDNTSIGYHALSPVSSGGGNTGVGAYALATVSTGSANVAVGEYSYMSGNGSNNVAVGDFAMQGQSGTGNVAVGTNTLEQGWNVTNYNTVIGSYAMPNGGQNGNNVAIGALALGGQNVSLSSSQGVENTGVGANAGLTNVSGSNNTFIGFSADAGSNSLTNATAIGNQAQVAASNEVQLGNGSVSLVNTSGLVQTTGGVNLNGANAQLQLNGSNGSAGQVLTSGGTTLTPTWATLSGVAVTAFHTTLSGLTPSASTSGSVTLAGTLGATSGGTGSSTAPTDDQILVGSTSGASYAPATLGTGAGISITPGSNSLTINNIGVTSNVAGSGISVSGGTGAVTISNTGVTSNVAGSGISVSGGTGAVTISNTGVTSNVAGSGISVSGGTGAVTISNTGVTSNVAGSGISVSGGTGAVTITNTGVTSLAGTANQITASASTGSVTLSLPNSVSLGTNAVQGAIVLTDGNVDGATGTIQTATPLVTSQTYTLPATGGTLATTGNIVNYDVASASPQTLADGNLLYNLSDAPSSGTAAAGAKIASTGAGASDNATGLTVGAVAGTTATATGLMVSASGGTLNDAILITSGQFANTINNLHDQSGDGLNGSSIAWQVNQNGYAAGIENDGVGANPHGLLVRTALTTNASRTLTLNVAGTDVFRVLGDGTTQVLKGPLSVSASNATADESITNASATTGEGLSVTLSSSANTSAAIHISTANTTTPANDIEGAKWAVTSTGHVTTSSAVNGTETSAESGGPYLTVGTATGSDVAGTVSFSAAANTGVAADNCTVTVSFGTTYGSAPTVVLFPASSAASSANTNIVGLYVTETATGFTLNFSIPNGSAAFGPATWNYLVIH